MVMAPIKNKKSPQGFDMVPLELLDPHAVVSYLFNNVGVELDPACVACFWQRHRNVQSPFMSGNDSTSSHIPLGLYGDSARARQQFYTAPEFINLPLWRPKAARFGRFLIFSIDESLLVGRRTLNCIMRWVTWSINSMFMGLWPTHGPSGELLNSPKAGQPLTKSRSTFSLVEIRGDWVFHKQVFGFRSSWKAGVKESVCFKCDARGTGNPQCQYYHVDENAPCWSNQHDTLQFLAREMPDADVCPLPESGRKCESTPASTYEYSNLFGTCP